MVPVEVVVILGAVCFFAAVSFLSVITFHTKITDQFSEQLTKGLMGVSDALFPFIRLIIYFFSIALSLGIILLSFVTINDDKTRVLFLVRSFGLTAYFSLFLTLTPGLLRVYFPRLPLVSLLIRARRALGISVFAFALFHSLIAFFYIFSSSLGKILTLSTLAQLGVLYGAVALGILLLLTITSSDLMMKFLTMRIWKMTHRLTYIATILVVFHAFIRGTHFLAPHSFFPVLMTFFVLSFILLEVGATVMELVRFPKKRHYLKLLPIFFGLSIITFASFIISISALNKMLH